MVSLGLGRNLQQQGEAVTLPAPNCVNQYMQVEGCMAPRTIISFGEILVIQSKLQVQEAVQILVHWGALYNTM